MQLDGVNKVFKLIFFNLTEFIVWNSLKKYLRSTTLGCEDIEIRKWEFVCN